jgi:hypothetical protein
VLASNGLWDNLFRSEILNGIEAHADQKFVSTGSEKPRTDTT